MRTSNTFRNDTIMPWSIDVRVVLITILTIVFYVKLAAAASIQPLDHHFFNDKNGESHGWIGDKDGDHLILELDAISIGNFEILLDGTPYQGQLMPHQEKNVYVYNLSELGQKTFFIHEFIFDDKVISGKFESPIALLDYLNTNTNIEWSFDMARGLLFCSNDNYVYNEIMISTLGSQGEVKMFQAGSTKISKNVSIKIPEGNHTITVNNFVTGLSETKELVVAKEMAYK